MSIIHHWRGVEVKVSLLQGTGLALPPVSDPLIIVRVGSFSSLCRSSVRLDRSDTGSSVTLKSDATRNDWGVNSLPPNNLPSSDPSAVSKTVMLSAKLSLK